MHVLLVEDDALVARGIVAGLALHRMNVYAAASAAEAARAFDAAPFDIVILDLGLPDGEGMTLLRHWRARRAETPVLILSARDAVRHRITGLEQGADDYMLKPFDLDELVARLRALWRRASGRTLNLIKHGRLTYDLDTANVELDGTAVELSRRERAVLEALLKHPQQVLTAERLRDHVYGLDESIESNAVSVHIYHLRRKLGAGIVETVRGLGYRLGEAGL